MLFFTLVSFITMVKLITNHAVIQMHSGFENAHRREVERFSLMESYVLTQTIKQFHAYKNETLLFEFQDGKVIVIFIDESAYLFFDYEKPIFSRLDYDLVFDSALNYIYIDESEYLLIDKKLD